MNIAIVCYPTFGGSGVVATELGIALAKKAYSVHFISYKQPVRLDFLNKQIHFHEVNVPEYSLFHYQPYELALSSKLVNIVKTYSINLIHVHYAIPHAYAAYMAKQMLESINVKVPIVTTLHGTDITLVGNHPFYKPAVTFSINQSDAVTSVSESLKRETLDSFEVHKNIEVIPNFVNNAIYEKPKNIYKRNNIVKPNEKLIVHISNFRRVKRAVNVVTIFNKIQKKVPAKLLMIGEGPEKEKAYKLAKNYNLLDKIIFTGNINEVNCLLQLSDLFILPSEKESFGLSALEAMANSTPVISSNSGGLPEINKHNKTGFLSDYKNIEEMVNNAIYLLENEDILAQFKKNAKDQALKLDVKYIIPQYECLYERVVNGKNNENKTKKTNSK